MTIQAFKHGLLAILLMFSCQVLAAATEDFNQGIELFKSRNYEASLKYFLTAQKQGIDSVELQYNLGSVYYKLERYEEAKTHFKKFGESEGMRDLADFNLAHWPTNAVVLEDRPIVLERAGACALVIG